MISHAANADCRTETVKNFIQINTTSSTEKVHICDYDGIDEMHWFAGQGIIQWNEVMAAIKEIPHDVLLISETMYQLGTKVSHIADPYFAIRQTEDSFFFLENCKEIMQAREKFRKSLA
jgi:hypothetical protein